MLLKQAIVFFSKLVVLSRGDEVESTAISQPVRRAFESANEETREDTRG